MTKTHRQGLPNKLAIYAAAASASWAAQDATAGIVFTDVGPGGVRISGTFDIDLDGDGSAEF